MTELSFGEAHLVRGNGKFEVSGVWDNGDPLYTTKALVLSLIPRLGYAIHMYTALLRFFRLKPGSH